MSSLFSKAFNKYLPNPESRKKFKRQCLKAKNILEQNQSIQIGCKIQKFYDFYTSKNFIQVYIFIGNKMLKPIQNYSVEFKGTENLVVYLEQKQEKFIKENNQVKERIVVQWLPQTQSQFYESMLLAMSFSSNLLTLRDIVIPLSLWSFYNFPLGLEQIITPSISAQNLLQKFKKQYELMEDQQLDLSMHLFRKEFNIKDMDKFFDKLIKLQTKQEKISYDDQKVSYFAGVFTIKTLLEQIGILIQVETGLREPKIKITLAGNEYTYFQAVFENLKFLFGK